jgi:DNA helicase-2/ATP-dependent DNA helicase PcrA
MELEQKHLDYIIEVLEEKIGEYTEIREKLNKEYRELNKELWEDVGAFIPGDVQQHLQYNQYIQMIKTTLTGAENAKRIYYNLLLLRKTPYFGRIDLRYPDNETETIYIGTSTLEKDREILICDWRADICSLFYEDRLGTLTYESPGGTVLTELTLKRQYKIEKDKIVGAFDTTVKIDDEILQEILSKNTDEKMSVIVRTIQQEQNKAIRDRRSKVLLVTGPAGSGKTSVALHRIAWLLYKNRDRIKADQIVALTPNKIFNDYISDVLPDLGEQNVVMKTFTDLGRIVLGPEFKVLSQGELMERYLKTKNVSNIHELIRWKNSLEFARLLEDHVNRYIDSGPDFDDIEIDGQVIITKSKLRELYASAKYLQYSYRMERVKTYIETVLSKVKKEMINQAADRLWETGEYTDEKEAKAVARMQINEKFIDIVAAVSQLLSAEPVNMYASFLKKVTEQKKISGIRITLRNLKNRIVPFEDIAPILYIHSRITKEDEDRRKIKHTVIDEVQDYSPLQIMAIRAYYRQADLTLLGDINQAINPLSNVGSMEVIKELTEEEEFNHIHMPKSYRSTFEITEFCNRLVGLKIDEQEAVNRHGPKPQVIPYESPEQLAEQLSGLIKEHSGERRSVALIGRSKKTSTDLYVTLSRHWPMRLIDSRGVEFYHGISAIPSYLAKGLEFDTVIVVATPEDMFSGEGERKLFYTACSRALHRLYVLYPEGKNIEYLED